MQADSGFVPVLYQQPWPLAGSIFGLIEVPHLLDRDVVARGWYRRNPRRLSSCGSRCRRRAGRSAGPAGVAYLLSVPLAVGGGAVWLAMSLTA
ncbi:MAG: Zn-dependent protease with chaperone function [Modestobacter sp.]|nr:Zn-dependent protease with chaperone function [Modestobacter sp.]